MGTLVIEIDGLKMKDADFVVKKLRELLDRPDIKGLWFKEPPIYRESPQKEFLP